MHKCNLLIAIVVFLICHSSDTSAAKLTKNEYKKYSGSMAVVLLDVNWGRKWGCGEFDNAQLLKLLFENTDLQPGGDAKYKEIKLKTPSRLFVDPVFLSYGFMVTAGTYAFTGWSVKVARSLKEVLTAEVGREVLVQGDTYLGGTFSIEPGEVIYIGNFWLDCSFEPMPWRLFTEFGEYWDDHIKAYKSQFNFLQEKEIQFRLLDTDYFGENPLAWLNNKGSIALAAGKQAEALTYYEEALNRAKGANDSLFTAISMFNLGRANGHACNYNNGVSWLVKSIALKKTVPDQQGAYLSQNYLELGRLYASREDWPNMISNYELAIPLLDTLDLQTTDPIGYADVLDVLHTAYQANGKSAQADQLAMKITALRAAHPDAAAKFKSEPYPTDCESREVVN